MEQDELIRVYHRIKHEIEERLKQFRELLEGGTDEEIFAELVFCLLTPQSKAKVCWRAVEEMKRRNLHLSGDEEEIGSVLRGVRFWRTKTKNVIEARRRFLERNNLSIRKFIESFENPFELREWLVRNIRGMGYKEASHFLRNIGLGGNMAILDRHILKNLKKFDIIEEIPSHLSRGRYLKIEEKMREFSRKIGIPLSHLDLLFWYMETGEIFK